MSSRHTINAKVYNYPIVTGTSGKPIRIHIVEKKMKGPYQILGSRDVYKNPWMNVREDSVIRPGGTEGIFGIVEMIHGSTILAINERREAFLVKEYRYGIGRDSIELVSGAIESAETPLDAAKRELKEELGIEASEWIDLGSVDPFTTVVRSPNHMFLALGIKEGESSPEDGEVLHITKLPFQHVVDMVMRSEITHSASCVLILKANKYLHDVAQGYFDDTHV